MCGGREVGGDSARRSLGSLKGTFEGLDFVVQGAEAGVFCGEFGVGILQPNQPKSSGHLKGIFQFKSPTTA